MSNFQNYVEQLPKSFNDELADSLLSAFNELTGVDVIDEIPHFMRELYNKGYNIEPQKALVINPIQATYFVRVFSKTTKLSEVEINLLDRIMFYNFKLIRNESEFKMMIKEMIRVESKTPIREERKGKICKIICGNILQISISKVSL